MGKSAIDINWGSLKKKMKEIAPLVTTLKRQNDELDALMVQLYDVFIYMTCITFINSLSFYKCYAGHIDNNEKWYKAFKKYNDGVANAKVISK